MLQYSSITIIFQIRGYRHLFILSTKLQKIITNLRHILFTSHHDQISSEVWLGLYAIDRKSVV